MTMSLMLFALIHCLHPCCSAHSCGVETKLLSERCDERLASCAEPVALTSLLNLKMYVGMFEFAPSFVHYRHRLTVRLMQVAALTVSLPSRKRARQHAAQRQP